MPRISIFNSSGALMLCTKHLRGEEFAKSLTLFWQTSSPAQNSCHWQRGASMFSDWLTPVVCAQILLFCSQTPGLSVVSQDTYFSVTCQVVGALFPCGTTVECSIVKYLCSYTEINVQKYWEMFTGVKSLTNSPGLHYIVISKSSYERMRFKGRTIIKLLTKTCKCCFVLLLFYYYEILSLFWHYIS